MDMTIKCAVPDCKATDKVPAFTDRSERDVAKQVKPVAVTPWVCLGCWLAGWRHDGVRLFGVIEAK